MANSLSLRGVIFSSFRTSCQQCLQFFGHVLGLALLSVDRFQESSQRLVLVSKVPVPSVSCNMA